MNYHGMYNNLFFFYPLYEIENEFNHFVKLFTKYYLLNLQCFKIIKTLLILKRRWKMQKYIYIQYILIKYNFYKKKLSTLHLKKVHFSFILFIYFIILIKMN